MSKFCFVITPIGDLGSSTRRRADGVFTEIICPALEFLQYLVERADHDKSPGIVTESIIQKILDADLVVADLTGQNPNVMYELAIRHATAKPVIQMLQAGERLPFDIASLNTIFFESDLAGRAKAIADLRQAHDALVNAPNLGNPVRRTLDLRAAEAGATSPQRAILRELADLRQLLTEQALVLQPVRELSKSSLDSQSVGELLLTDRRLESYGVSSLTSSVAEDGTAEVTGVYRGLEVWASSGPRDWASISIHGIRNIGQMLTRSIIEQCILIDHRLGTSGQSDDGTTS